MGENTHACCCDHSEEALLKRIGELAAEYRGKEGHLRPEVEGPECLAAYPGIYSLGREEPHTDSGAEQQNDDSTVLEDEFGGGNRTD